MSAPSQTSFNTKLVNVFRTLNEKIRSTSSETSKTSNDTESSNSALDDIKQSAINSSNESTNLKNQLDTITIRSNNSKKIISQLGDEDMNALFAKIEQSQLVQGGEREAAFKTSNEEINNFIQEFKATRSTAAEVTRLKAELVQARRNELKLTERITECQTEKEKVSAQNKALKEYIAAKDGELIIIKDALDDYKNENQSLHHDNTALKSCFEITTTENYKIKEKSHSDSVENTRMSHSLESMHSRMKLLDATHNNDVKNYKDTIEKLNRELQHVRDILYLAHQNMNSYRPVNHQIIQDRYSESVAEIRLLKTNISEIEQQLSNVNDDKIVAQAKLAAAEEKLIASSNSSDSITCEEHIHWINGASEHIRMLESNIKKYQTTMAEYENKIDIIDKEHFDFVANSQEYVNKLTQELEAKANAVKFVQAEAEIISKSAEMVQKVKSNDDLFFFFVAANILL